MTDSDLLMTKLAEWAERGHRLALATVVGVRGSTYRGLGARQLVGDDGTSIGTISGGCLDQELTVIARRVMETGVVEVAEFDLTSDDEAVWGWGIGCNGATAVLVEPTRTAVELVAAFRTIRASERPTVIVHTVAGGPLGARAFVSGAGVEGSLPNPVVDLAREALEVGRHRVIDTETGRYLLEVVGSPSRLVVFGAGHDAVPVVRFGAQLGFEVMVVDERPQFLSSDRFPEAVSLIHLEPEGLASAIGPDRRTYVVLMSHNYLRDLAALRSLVGTDVAYIGTLGPRARLDRLVADLAEAGIEIDGRSGERLFGPAGLDIGAEGPTEIAWAIMAEILAVRRARNGGFLRSIHPRSPAVMPA